MLNHHLLRHHRCEKHGSDYMREVRGRPHVEICTYRADHARNPCRARAFRFSPYLNSRSGVDIDTLLLIWGDIANNLTTGQISRNRGVRQGTVTKFLHMVGNAAFHQQENTDFNFSKLQVGETFIGKRKYNRGKRVRK